MLMNVVVDGLMTNYQKAGSGDAIVLLHGWGDSGSTFKELAKDLQGEYQLLVLDLPGFGGTQVPPASWDLNDYADFIDHWLNKTNTTKVAAFIGHSYGGSILIKGIGDGKLKSEKLVLIASAGVRNKQKIKKTALKALAKAGKIPLALLPASQQQRIRRKLYTSVGSDAMLAPHMQQTFRRIISQDVQGAAAKIDQPTLLIYGRDDKSTPPSDGRLLHQTIAGSKLEMLDGSHFIHQEAPQKVASLIKDFLK